MSGKYTLNLDEDQFLLIGRLISQVRLGSKTRFSDAAFDLCTEFEQIDPDLFNNCYNEVELMVTADGQNGTRILELSGDEAIFEV
jgi:hypothetical protein